MLPHRVGQGKAPSWGLKVAGHRAGSQGSPSADQGPVLSSCRPCFWRRAVWHGSRKGKAPSRFSPRCSRDWTWISGERLGQAGIAEGSSAKGPALALPRAERNGPSGHEPGLRSWLLVLLTGCVTSAGVIHSEPRFLFLCKVETIPWLTSQG